MSVDIQTIRKDSEIDELIQKAEAAGELLHIQIGNARYAVVRANGTEYEDPRDYDPVLVSDPKKIWENYDPERECWGVP